MALISERNKKNKAANKVKEVAKMINSKFKKTVCFLGAASAKILEIRRVTSGILGLDIALGGGFPNGFIQFWGPESSGKTTGILRHIAVCQQCDENYTAAFVDVEHTLDPEWAGKCGVDLERLIVVQPATAEQALDTVEELVNARVDTIVVDSVAALSGKAEIAQSNEGQLVGTLPRCLSKFFRKCTATMQPDVSDGAEIDVNFSRVIFVNQVREKIGTYGGGEQYPGGRALRHALRVSIKTRRGDGIKGKARSGLVGDVMEEKSSKGKSDSAKAAADIAHYVLWQVDKNKTHPRSPVVRSVLNVFDSDEGEAGTYDHAKDLIRFGMMFGVFAKNKATWTDDEGNKFNGIAKLKAHINDNEEYYWRKYAQILKQAIGEEKYAQITVAGFKAFENSRKQTRKKDSGKTPARKWQSMA